MVLPFYIVQALTVGGLPELEVGTLLAAQAVGGHTTRALRATGRGFR